MHAGRTVTEIVTGKPVRAGGTRGGGKRQAAASRAWRGG